MWLEGLPSFPEITVAEAHGAEVGGIWMPQKSGTWLCFLKLPRGSTPEDTGGRNGPKNQQQVLGALETLRQLAACPGEEKGPKREAAEVGWVRAS